MNWIIENKEWIFSGIGVLIIGTILNYFSDNKKDKKIGLTEIKPEIKTNINPVINPVNNINVNFGRNEDLDNKTENPKNVNLINRDAIIESLKSKIHILFIDDDKKMYK